MSHELYRLAKNVGVLLGMAAIGAAMGLTLSLELLQQAAIAENAWVTIATNDPQQNALWVAAKQLQTWANTFAVIGAVLLLVYGVADRYEERLLEAIS